MAITLSPYGERLYDGVSVLPQVDDSLGKVCAGLAGPFEQVAWVRGLGTDLQPYRQAMRVATAPLWLLPYLGQFVGVTIPQGTSEADARAMVLARTHQKRGLPQTIVDVAKTYLTGSKFVHLEEHADDNPYFFRLYFHSGEVPADLTDLKRGVSAVKPGGFTFEISVSNALTWNAALNTWNNAQGEWDLPASPPNA